MKGEIQNIIFDIGGVILHVDFARPVGIMARETGLSPERIMEDIFNGPELERYDRGRIGCGEFFQSIRSRFNMKMDEREMKRLWSDIFEENAAVSGLIRRWHGTVPLFLLSNTCKSHVDQFEAQFDVFKLFNDRVYSFETGHLKPELEIFEQAIRRFQIDPLKTLFIDDKEDNVEGANRVGLHALRFIDSDTLLKDLAKLGLR